MRVLIADDQKDVGKSLAELVSFCNHQIVGVVGSGLEAIQAYTQHQPDHVLMDYQMPKLNGTTALRNILSKDPAARVIFVTGWSLADEASASGAIAIVLKPIDLERLNATLQAVAQMLPVPAGAEPPTPKVSSQPDSIDHCQPAAHLASRPALFGNDFACRRNNQSSPRNRGSGCVGRGKDFWQASQQSAPRSME